MTSSAGGLGAAALLGAGPLGCISAPPKLEELTLSSEAQALVRLAWEGIDPARVIDTHVHVIGLGAGGTGCFVHPGATSLSHPIRYAKTWFYKSAAGIYEVLAERGLVLISHAGEEQAVEAPEAQELGNPLRLRPALEAGVTVFVAHCASLGTNRDLDAKPNASGEQPQLPSYDLFRRLMEHDAWRGRLFGEISAMTQFNRCRDPLRRTLIAPQLHDRLTNGSDYPLPAIDPVIRTGLLVDLGYLDAAERPLINELFDYDPLTFDFVLKRRLSPSAEGETYRFPAEVFMSADRFPALVARRKSAAPAAPANPPAKPG
ncbi:MAG: hypothetical protein JKY65_29720 [Planctomycetes bacterium]|nr:hypothetical protein [Planctomycetota bacterium]